MGERFQICMQWCISAVGDECTHILVTAALECKKSVIISPIALEKAAIQAILGRINYIRSELTVCEANFVIFRATQKHVEPRKMSIVVKEPIVIEQSPPNQSKFIAAMLAVILVLTLWNVWIVSSLLSHKGVLDAKLMMMERPSTHTSDWQYEKAVLMTRTIARMRRGMDRVLSAVQQKQRIRTWLADAIENQLIQDM